MAKSFWSKRNVGSDTTNYIRSVDAVSRPMAILLTVVGIAVIGGLLFGVFQGARWSFNKLAGNDEVSIPTNTASTNTTASPDSPSSTTSATTPKPEVTATSSTSTTTPSGSVATTTLPATNTQALPSTGAGSNTAVFFAVLIVSYLIYRKKALKNQ